MCLFPIQVGFLRKTGSFFHSDVLTKSFYILRLLVPANQTRKVIPSVHFLSSGFFSFFYTPPQKEMKPNRLGFFFFFFFLPFFKPVFSDWKHLDFLFPGSGSVSLVSPTPCCSDVLQDVAGDEALFLSARHSDEAASLVLAAHADLKDTRDAYG